MFASVPHDVPVFCFVVIVLLFHFVFTPLPFGLWGVHLAMEVPRPKEKTKQKPECANVVFPVCLSLEMGVAFSRVSLCSLGCSGTHSVDKAGLKLIEISTSQVLGLKA